MKLHLYIVVGVLCGMATQYFQEKTSFWQTPPEVQTARRQRLPVLPVPLLPERIDRILPPVGYSIVQVPGNGFGKWLLGLPLRKNNVLYLHNGQRKAAQHLHYAILDVPYNYNPLQQCADAVMRLRAEYLYATKAEPVIRFLHQKGKYFTCSTACTRPQLEAFLNQVFSWCGTYNLQAQLHPVAMQQVQAGDVLVRGGAPGHAMLVAAVAQNKQGRKVFLLLQSFIPAQNIHLVMNTFNESLSPWYDAEAATIATPGYTFIPTDLRRW